jgi:hypothetical protein
MASTQRFFSQPLTRNFVNTQDNSSGDEYGPYMFSQAAIDEWAADNTSTVTQLGSIYILPVADFTNVVGDLNSFRNIQSRKTIKDMGKEIIIGTASQPRLLVLRKVQQYSPASSANGATETSYTGYIVIENNAEDLGDQGGRFMVRCARV